MRSYDLSELEAQSDLSRRTISDYVSRGLLSGPSHRGRGARYSQRDLDALLNFVCALVHRVRAEDEEIGTALLHTPGGVDHFPCGLVPLALVLERLDLRKIHRVHDTLG